MFTYKEKNVFHLGLECGSLNDNWRNVRPLITIANILLKPFLLSHVVIDFRRKESFS